MKGIIIFTFAGILSVWLLFCFLKVRKLRGKIDKKIGDIIEWREVGFRSPMLLDWKDIPAASILFTVLFEDEEFFHHSGVNLRQILSRVKKWLFKGEKLGGGSSISQQLSKNLFTSKSRTLRRKFLDIIYATLLELQFSKEEILQLYLSTTRYGSGVYGIREASRRYFGKPSSELTPIEAAFLAVTIPFGIKAERRLLVRGNTSIAPSSFIFKRYLDVFRRFKLQKLPVSEIEKIKPEEAINYLKRKYKPKPLSSFDDEVELEKSAAIETTKFLSLVNTPLKYPTVYRGVYDNSLQATERIIICSVRAALLTPEITFPPYLTDQIHLSSLKEIASRHKVLPLVYKGLLNVGNFESIKNQLTIDLQERAKQTLLTQKTLEEVGSALTKENLDWIVWKGIATSARYYESLTLREAGDIDLLIREKDLKQASEVISKLGYRNKDNRDNAIIFYPLNSGPTIDLHIQPFEKRFGHVSSSFWDRKEKIKIGSVDAYFLSLFDDFLFSIIHASKHNWGKLIWIADILQIYRKFSDKDLETFLNLPEAAQYKRRILTSFSLLFNLFEINYPPLIEKQLPSWWEADTHAWRIMRDLFRKITPSKKVLLDNTFHQISFMESKLDKARYLLDRIF